MLTEEFYVHCNQLQSIITDKNDELRELLSHYETHEAVDDEMTRSLNALKGFRNEFSNIDKPLSGLSIATFFPLNLPFYSLILFGVAPSAFASTVYIRPPEVMHEILNKLWGILEMEKLFPNISLKISPRHVFVQLYASESDAIIFTGKYENALDIHNKCPDSLLIYNGSGVNPFIVFDNADIDLAVEKSVEMRCFNSGQDCAGPDVFFVHSSIADEYTRKLTDRLHTVKVGDSTDPNVTVSKTMKQSYIDELKSWVEDKKDNIVYGGDIDEENHLVEPSIIRRHARDHTIDQFHEFFAPYFYVLEFDSDKELEALISLPAFQDRGMYVSVFGDNDVTEKQLTYTKILKNKIVNDVEYGNDEYGGYGPKANFLLYGDEKIVKPVLISRDMHDFINSQA